MWLVNHSIEKNHADGFFNLLTLASIENLCNGVEEEQSQLAGVSQLIEENIYIADQIFWLEVHCNVLKKIDLFGLLLHL